MAQIRPRNIVFVGNRDCGKSSIITCCFKLRSTRPRVRMSISKANSAVQELPLIIDPIYLETDQDKESVPMLLIDTAAKDVAGTQEHIRQSDLIAVVASINDETHLDKAKDYWLNDQLKALRPTQPMCLVLNKVDCINSEQHEMIIAERRELLEHPIWEKVFYVSSKTGSGIEQMLKEFSNTLKSVISYPHAVLYNRWENKLCANFRVAITRVFRCLDVNDNGILGLAEFQVLYKDILNLECTREGFNLSVQGLKLDRDGNVKDGGVTLQGFMVLMLQMVLDRKWKHSWTILRHFNYEDDLTLTPRWTLPELEPDQVIKLLPTTFKFLEELFTIYSVQKKGQPVISTDAIANLLNVMPGNESSALIILSLKSNMFETDNDPESPSLTLNGWLSFWAILANENAPTMLRQLDYLLSSSKRTNSGEWFSVCQPKSAECESKRSERNFIRALVLSDIEAGKSTFCRRLIGSHPSTRRDRYDNPQQKAGYEIYCNRVQIPDDPYCFLCLTEIRSDNHSLEKAVIKLLPAYDLVLLAYDLSNKKSFLVMEDILEVLVKYNVANLPVQVLALKADIVDRSFNHASKRLQELGLQPQEVTSAKHWDLTKLFECLVRLGQMPGAGRVRPRPKTGIHTYIKRTVTISMLFSIVYGLYRVYQQKIGVNEVSNSVSTANAPPTEPTVFREAAAFSVVGALNTRQGKQL